ncbi:MULTISPECIES: hypothetical protein [unclassified Breznakia]|uniref:hypothetical protein n=1 Tax=unclassified Breznakia TaxID=2623764 RepID=UPI00240630AF|nr:MULTISPECIES: hypothetical protein [unclassified Breznakia]MDF9837569.1 hypothetical protein [Breznakia sp. PFB2-8]MDF9860182.1 hypothetical protein [Breznakia sp. PH5-24]
MKKNKSIKIVTFLFVAMFVTTTLVSNVFAQYISNTDKDDSAGIAQWGVVTSAKGSLFTQKDATGKNIIYPGDKSKDTGLTINISGTPQVNGVITATVKHQNIFLGAGQWGLMTKQEDMSSAKYKANTYYTLSSGKYVLDTSSVFTASKTYYMLENNVTVDTSGYWPVNFKLTGESSTGYVESDSNKTKTDTLDGVSGTIEAALFDSLFKANENLAYKYGLHNQSITWEWQNCTSDCSKGISVIEGESTPLCDNCKRDVILQNLIDQKNDPSIIVVLKDTTDTTGKTFKTPTAATEQGEYKDGNYNLYVSFNLKVIASQED